MRGLSRDNLRENIMNKYRVIFYSKAAGEILLTHDYIHLSDAVREAETSTRALGGIVATLWELSEDGNAELREEYGN